MSISTVSSSRSELLAEAHAEWTRQAERKATLTGERAQSVPPDSVLIATDPVLRAEILAIDSESTSDSGGAAPMGGGPAKGASPNSDLHITTNATSSDSTGSATDSTTGATADAITYSGTGTAVSSSVQSGRVVSVLA